MRRRKFAAWEDILHQSVADYQAASMLIMKLDMSNPGEFPDSPSEVYEQAGELYNNAQTLSREWSSEAPKSDILTTSKFHAYRRITSAIAFTLRLYYDLVPWIIGADTRLSEEATRYVVEVKKNLIFQFSVLRDVPAIKRRDIPRMSEMVSRIDIQVGSNLKSIRDEIAGWDAPTR